MERFVTSVIVAAGKSTRMKSKQSKQFLPVLGKPAIFYTLLAFSQSKSIDEIVIVCREDDKENFLKLKSENDFNKISSVVSGGQSRQQSVLSGVLSASKKTTHYAIHDGARICILPETIDQVVEKAVLCQAATVGVLVKDTIKVVNGEGAIEQTPDRSRLWSIQTPQVFEKELYLSAVQHGRWQNKEYTDDCQLVEQLGEKVFVVKGEYTNIKMTTPDDLLLAESILKDRGENKNENWTRI